MMRVPRLPQDRAGEGAEPLGRYRCRQGGCAWEGLIQRHASSAGADTPHESTSSALVTALSQSHWLRLWPVLLIGLAAAATLGGWLQLNKETRHGPAAQVNARFVPLGISHDGEALPDDHPLLTWADDPDSTPATLPAAVQALARAASAPASSVVAQTAGLTLRQRCAWGQPGRSPYKGTVEQALTAAKLPADIVKLIADKVRAHDNTDRLTITNAAIRGDKGGKEFDPRTVVMTYGHTLCLATRVNFKAGHQERADLYQVADKTGKRYAVMVPDVCGNVSVLAERGEAFPVKVLAAAQAQADSFAQSGSGGAHGSALGSTAGGGANSSSVPEPGTLASVALALGLLGWLRRRTKSTRR